MDPVAKRGRILIIDDEVELAILCTRRFCRAIMRS